MLLLVERFIDYNCVCIHIIDKNREDICFYVLQYFNTHKFLCRYGLEADVYSYGMVMYSALSRRTPYFEQDLNCTNLCLIANRPSLSLSLSLSLSQSCSLSLYLSISLSFFFSFSLSCKKTFSFQRSFSFSKQTISASVFLL